MYACALYSLVTNFIKLANKLVCLTGVFKQHCIFECIRLWPRLGSTREAFEIRTMADEGGEKRQEAETKRVVHTYPLIRHSDMNDEMKTEAMELCVTACEKFSSNNETAAKMIKETMDKKFGASWHAIVGEGFGYEITHEVKNMLYMFFGGTMAIVVWKCS